MSSPLATVGILSIGQMGLGIAKLLIAHNYRVLTNVTDRSAATHDRAKNAHIGLVDSDEELVVSCDYILSIVPPRDAVATSARIISAVNNMSAPRASQTPLYYLDLNAISPSTAKSIAASFDEGPVLFIDGGIIGGPPAPPTDPASGSWTRPAIPISGPNSLTLAPLSGAHLASALNTKNVSLDFGSASGLKCCFAALSKGMTALALQSFTTASSLGVLPHLQDYLKDFNPRAAQAAEKGIVGCPQKAYRWVEEMNQIGECFAIEGGWDKKASVFMQIAGVFEGLAQVVERRRGTDGMETLDGALRALEEGLKGKSEAVTVEEIEQDDR